MHFKTPGRVARGFFASGGAATVTERSFPLRRIAPREGVIVEFEDEHNSLSAAPAYASAIVRYTAVSAGGRHSVHTRTA